MGQPHPIFNYHIMENNNKTWIENAFKDALKNTSTDYDKLAEDAEESFKKALPAMLVSAMVTFGEKELGSIIKSMASDGLMLPFIRFVYMAGWIGHKRESEEKPNLKEG